MAGPHKAGYSLGMRHVLFAIVMALFILYGGQNWHHYAATLMTAAWIKHGGRLNDPIW